VVDVCTFVAIKSGRRVLFFSFLVAVDDSLQVTIVVYISSAFTVVAIQCIS